MSGTMIAAHTAGIPVFVTGGIGGVHRGASESKFSIVYIIAMTQIPRYSPPPPPPLRALNKELPTRHRQQCCSDR